MTYENQLQKLRNYYRRNNDLPTYDEMRELFQYKSKSTAFYAINKLITAGFLKRKGHKIIPGKNFLGMPYFQSVKAGFPGPAEEEANDRMSLDQYLIEKPNSTMLIKVKGDSMINVGINDGDIVIVERTANANPGQIIVVNLEGEFTVKTLRKTGRKFFLDAENPEYPSLPLDGYASHSLVGVVKGVVRKY
ncbi:translesion error-prone DNA polymerase V autoproteolytic subunit [Candidatus Peregrinibacteria bacterium]|nr:translesion error-prone DNA polymerase V autoproteolytic subunit [Candidatus Peregrinibacteria bacterium]